MLDQGVFNGPVCATWSADGRSMQLDSTVTYTDPAGKVWTAPAGSVVDGASIPRVLWRLCGSPFVGRYRRASVIHDVYCVLQIEPWRAVHKVFHQMMIADGVPTFKRRVMYDMVKVFGPRWTTEKEHKNGMDN